MTPIRHLATQVERLNLRLVGRALVFSSLIGIVAGAGAIIFQLLSQWALHLFLDGMAGYHPVGPPGDIEMFHPTGQAFHMWLLPLIPALGGLLCGILVVRFAPEAEGHGTDAAVEAFHHHAGLIRARVPIIKTLASALSLGTGGSGGREGPIAQIGAGFGSFLATRLGLSERDRRILLAAGVGAGVGSIFRAPLAGALFSAEILYSDPEFESEVVIPGAIATIVAYCVFSLKFGFGSLFLTPRFVFVSPLELVPYTALAIVCALGAVMFVTIFYRTHDAFHAFRIPAVVKPMLGGLATGLLGLVLFLFFRQQRVLDVLGFGYGTVQAAIDSRMAIPLLLAVGIGKMITTSLTIGSGGSAGVFGPSMVIGGCLGGVVGALGRQFMPNLVTQPGAFVVVGMAGFFAAAANTPISTLVMVSEMTGNYQLLLPTLWVCALSYMLARRWTLYRSQVRSRLDSPAHRGAIFVDVLVDLRVRDVVPDRPPPRTLPQSASLPEVLEAFAQSSQHHFPVVDSQGRTTGILSVNDLRQFLDRRDPGTLLIAHDIATTPVVTLSLDDDLNTALQRFVTMDEEDLPVVDPKAPDRVIALVSRRDLIAAYNRRRLERLRKAEEARAATA